MGKHHEGGDTYHRAKTGAGRRKLDGRLPQILENPKSLLAIKGHATSAVGNAVLGDIHMLKKPLCKKMQRKNDILPFEAGGETHLENLARLNDCSLFALTNHTKKRPHNLVLGRMFGFRILDMMEFGVSEYQPMAECKRTTSPPGSKPLLLFNGDDFEATQTTRTMKSLLLDVFRGPYDVKRLNLAGVDRVIVFTLQGEDRVLFRQYSIDLRKNIESPLPRVVLEESGPNFDMTLRRTQLASEGMAKDAMRKAKDPRLERKTKNVIKDDIGDKRGRVHLGKQDLSTLALARMKGLNKKRGHIDAHVGGDREDEGGNREDEGGNDSADDVMEDIPRDKRQRV